MLPWLLLQEWMRYKGPQRGWKKLVALLPGFSQRERLRRDFRRVLPVRLRDRPGQWMLQFHPPLLV